MRIIQRRVMPIREEKMIKLTLQYLYSTQSAPNKTRRINGMYFSPF